MDVSITGRLYEPFVLSLKVDIKTTLRWDLEYLAARPNLTALRSHPELHLAVSTFIQNVMVEGRQTAVVEKYTHYPIIELLEIETEHFPTWQELARQNIARVLIRNVAEGRMRNELVDKLFVKSEGFNYKTNEEYLLLDKQALLFIASKSNDSSAISARHKTLKSAEYLLEIGFVYQVILTKFFGLRNIRRASVEYILSRIEAWCHHPTAVLHATVTGSNLWTLISNELRITELFELIYSRDYIRSSLSAHFEAFDLAAAASNPWHTALDIGLDTE
ncbi:UNVERIFIED_CONTAM: hypothetical protein Q9R71_11860 [Actinomycetes bacterium ARC8]|nr:hypothetical protein [Actinomycetes bacterium ARC8]